MRTLKELKALKFPTRHEMDLIISGQDAYINHLEKELLVLPEAKYKLEYYPAIGCPCKELEFETKAELIAAKDSISYMLLFMQDELKIMSDYSNMSVCFEKVDGDWGEIEI